ncbi:MAG: hypothetical protein ACR5KV_01175 [Wolbachia sp.]
MSRKFPISTELFLANVYTTQRISCELISQELQQRKNFRDKFERIKIQLREKEQELDRVLYERMVNINKILQLERNFAQINEEKNTLSSKNIRFRIKSLNILKANTQIKNVITVLTLLLYF